MSDAWVNKNADPDDPKWIRSRKPPREGWYGALLKTQVRRRDDDGNIYYVTKYREYVELWDGEKWADHAGEILAWDRFVLENTCHRPVESDEGALRLAMEITAGAADELVRAYDGMADKRLPRYSRREAELVGDRLRRFIKGPVFAALSMAADPETVIERCMGRALEERKKREKAKRFT